MTIADAIQLITAIAAAVAGVGTVWNNINIAKTHQKVAETQQKVAELETNTNSIKDALVDSTKREAFQAGQIDQASRLDPTIVSPS